MSAPESAATPRPSLGDSINIATRSVHAKLNKLILLRLPLAVPPHSPTPSTYVTGLLHFAPIYIAFERLWQSTLEISAAEAVEAQQTQTDEPLEPTSTPAVPLINATETLNPLIRPPVCSRNLSILQHMNIPSLARSARLRADIQSLTGWSDDVVEEQLQAVSSNGRLSDFISHIERSITTNPHVLLGYAWVLYMALFSGGRFIRASLESLGDNFWKASPMPVRPNMTECSPSRSQAQIAVAPIYSDESHLDSAYLGARPLAPANHHSSHRLPLDFFHFPTLRDGEDLKQEFKKRLLESENQLTAAEKDDIVREAGSIFDNMALLVEQLDEICGTPVEDEGSVNSWTKYLTPRLGTRLRDSIAVAKIRGLRKKTSSSEESSGTSESEENGKQSSGSASEEKDSPDFKDEDIERQVCTGLRRSESPRAVHFGTSLPRPKKADMAPRHHFSTDGASDKVCPVARIALAERHSTFSIACIPNFFIFLGIAAITLGFVYVQYGRP